MKINNVRCYCDEKYTAALFKSIQVMYKSDELYLSVCDVKTKLRHDSFAIGQQAAATFNTANKNMGTKHTQMSICFCFFWVFMFMCVCVCARENKRIDKLVDHHRRRRRHYGTFDFGCIAFDGAYEISKKQIVSFNFYLIFYFEISCAYAYLFMCRSNNTPCAVSVPPMCVFCVFICLFILLLKWKFNSEKKRKKKKNHVTNPSIESKWQWTPIGNIDICIDGENNWG